MTAVQVKSIRANQQNLYYNSHEMVWTIGDKEELLACSHQAVKELADVFVLFQVFCHIFPHNSMHYRMPILY